MGRSSENGDAEEESNDDNGSAPHEKPLNQIEEGQPSPQQPSQQPPPYKPRRTANKRNASGLSFSLKLKPSSSDSSDTANNNIPRRASDPIDVESQRNLSSSSQPTAVVAPPNNNFSTGASSPTVRRSIFKVGRRESDNISEASSSDAPADINNNTQQSHARK